MVALGFCRDSYRDSYADSYKDSYTESYTAYPHIAARFLCWDNYILATRSVFGGSPWLLGLSGCLGLHVAAWVGCLALVACGCLCSVVAYGCLHRYRYRYRYKQIQMEIQAQIHLQIPYQNT